MLGAASISLLQVAKGAAEVYAERNIMLWDIAAGLAIVEGADGSITLGETGVKEMVNVTASNGVVELPWSA
jgi:myo-inositol-1(or 4)-monophosphatase